MLVDDLNESFQVPTPPRADDQMQVGAQGSARTLHRSAKRNRVRAMKIVDVAEYYSEGGGGIRTYIQAKMRAGATTTTSCARRTLPPILEAFAF